MKTILITLVLIANALIGMSQITLEHSYDYSASVNEISNGEFSYYLLDVPLEQCRLYNTNHTLIKTIDLPIPNGYYASDIKFVTKHLFNTDDLIEVLCIYEKYVSSGTSYYLQYGLLVVNENGTLLLTLNDGAWAEIKKVDKENKLIAYKYIYNPLDFYDVTTNIYSLGGTSKIETKSIAPNKMVYPNPATNQITIDGSLLEDAIGGKFTLYNINGQKVLSHPIVSNKNITIPVNFLPAGSYIYSIQNKNNLIQSNTIIIR
ncbi:MAG: T9SS type A sorting domain-containing protein [Salinivirgaceae bacterium]|nr:T9SS type A sorting domain-containing protein [Salinivirgaceae bacterium]